MSDPTSSGSLPVDSTGAAAADWRNDPGLSEKWKFRFDFFEKYGVPGFGAVTPEFKAGFKALSFGQRGKISMNFYAFFFSFIYYGFFLKLWRQALIIVGVSLIAGALFTIFNLSDSVARGLGIGLQVFFSLRANALYYLKRTQGDIGWKI